MTVSLASSGASRAAGNDTLSGIEYVQGSNFDDSLLGDSVTNALSGGTGRDTLDGGLANDTLRGQAGNDSLVGGDGIGDWAGFTAAVTVDLGAGTAFGEDADTLIGLENILTAASSDSLLGDTGGNILNAGDGANTLSGAAGNDTLIAGSDIDSLAGGLGDDSLVGGGGGTADWAFYGDATGAVTVDLATSSASGAAGSDTLSGLERVIGGNLNDSLLGDASSNTLHGNAGDDDLDGRNGADSLFGDLGNDTLIGGLANDTLDGGPGNNLLLGGDETADWISYASAGSNVTVDMLLGTALVLDRADNFIGFENLQGGNFDDSLLGDSLSNILSGGNGRDTLDGGTANDTLRGEAGNDSLVGGDGADWAGFTARVTVDLGAGTAFGEGADTLGGIENILAAASSDSILGDTGDNILNAGDGANTVSGAAGNDTLITGTGTDSLAGGIGDDSLSGGTGVDWAFYGDAGGAITVDLSAPVANATGAAGNDTLIAIENIHGGNGDDSLLGDSLGNSLAGGAGDDTLLGNSGNDTLLGQAGNDSLVGGSETSDWVSYVSASGTVTIDLAAGITSGAEGIDALAGIEGALGSNFDDSLLGDSLSNILSGGNGRDTLDGGTANDTLRGEAGNDSLVGGDGADWAGFTARVTVDLGAGTAFGEGADTLGGVENILTAASSDSILGDTGGNVLNAADGANTVAGAEGNDTLIAGTGTDSLAGGLGDDSLSGGTGTDWAFYGEANGAVTVDLNGFLGFATGADGNDTLSSIENVQGVNFADSLMGDSLGNSLAGGAGDDTLLGNSGNDTLVGQAGNDSLSGGADTLDWAIYAEASSAVTVDLIAGTSAGADGNDTLAGIEGVLGGNFDDSLLGDSAANQLFGGNGRDTLDGGLANDTLRGEAGNDSLVGGGGADWAGFTARVTVDLGAGTAFGEGADTLSGLENIVTAASSDSILGDTGGNILNAGDGANTVSGAAGNDTLIAGTGDDSLAGGLGDDSLSGGTGMDWAFFGDASGAVTVDLQMGRAFGADGNDTLSGFDVGADGVVGSNFDDSLIGVHWDDLLGGAGNDTIISSSFIGGIEGGRGDDSLIGREGAAAWVIYLSASGSVTVDLIEQRAFGAEGNDTLFNIPIAISGNFDDSLLGDSRTNILDARAGQDTLSGGAGNDKIRTGEGDDSIDGGDGIDWWGDTTEFPTGAVTVDLVAGTTSGVHGFDTLTGIENVMAGTGADSLLGDSQANILDGSTGNNTLSGSAGNDTLIGNSGADCLAGGADDDSLLGGNGSDNLSGGLGNDTLVGGGSANTYISGSPLSVAMASRDFVDYTAATGSITLDFGLGRAFGADGDDSLSGFVGVLASEYNDSILGTTAQNMIYDGAGDDTVVSLGGEDLIYAAPGNDSLDGSTANRTWLDFSTVTSGATIDIAAGRAFGAGNDTIANFSHYVLGLGNNSLLGGPNAQDPNRSLIIFPGAGNDTIDVGSTRSQIWWWILGTSGISLDLTAGTASGGGGFDNFMNLSADDQIMASDNADSILGSDRDDNIVHRNGHDTIVGGAGNDSITDYAEEAAGNDSIIGGLGDDLIAGGPGTDWVSYINASGGVTVNLAETALSSVGAEGNDTLIGIENVRGGDFSDGLIGNSAANFLDGGSGNDTLIGGAGNNTLVGSLGDDQLDGGAESADWLSHASATGAVIVDLSAGTTSGADGNDTLSSIEAVLGGNFDDSVLGDDNANLITGGFGNDTLSGGAGNDTISYQDMTDSLLGVTVDLGAGTSSGGAGNDSLSGFEILLGGTGNDSLVGDALDNWISAAEGGDSLVGLGGNDTLVGGPSSWADNWTNGFSRFRDWADYSAANGAVTVSLTANATSGAAGTDSLIGIENIQGSNGDDSILGNSDMNLLEGGLGNDTLVGSNHGGMGDIVGYGTATSGVTVSLLAGTSNGAHGIDSLIGFEGILGGSGNDSLVGGTSSRLAPDANQVHFGGGGDDTIVGGDTNVGNWDEALYMFATGSVTVDLVAGTTSGADGNDSLISIEFVRGSDFGDWLAVGSEQFAEGFGGNNTIVGLGTGAAASYHGISPVTVNMVTGTAIHAGGTDSLYGIDRVSVNGNSSLLGNDNANYFDGTSWSAHDTMDGGSGNDTLMGGRGDDSLIGGSGQDWASYARPIGGFVDWVNVDLNTGIAIAVGFGNDTLTGIEGVLGSDGNDVLRGSARDETLAGANGNDVLDGGAGNDWVSYADVSGAVTVDLAAGVSNGAGGNDSLTRFEGIFGGNGDDSLLGNSLANTLAGGVGNDTLVGGAQNDWASYADAFTGVTVNLGAGSSEGADSFDIVTGIEAVLGGNSADSLIGSNGANTLHGAGGNDTLDGDAGDDMLIGGAGTDMASYASATSAVTIDLGDTSSIGAPGNDTLFGIENILGGNFDDSLVGDTADNILNGGLGNDTLSARAGNDTLFGGDGEDVGDFRGFGATVTLDLTNSLVLDEGGTSYFVSLESILTDTGKINLSGDKNSFSIAGSNANEMFLSSEGSDSLYGDDGQDTISAGGAEDTVSGGNGADSITGGNGDDFLVGDDGSDILLGDDGNDSVDGDFANDTIQGGGGNDYLLGGAGNDLVDYSYVPSHGVTVDLVQETALGGSEDTVIGFENIGGTNFDDSLAGDSATNWLFGSAGNDTLDGRGGDDSLDGGNNGDVLLGGEGADTAVGGDGDDSLSGGSGDDELRGGNGSDTLIGGLGNDTLIGGDGADWASFSDATAGVLLNLSGSSPSAISGAEVDQVSSIENIVGSSFADTLISNASSGTILGGDGVDSILGDGGNDWLDFGAGNEFFLRDISEAGNDTLIGGEGNNTLDLGSNWSFLSMNGDFSLYRDQADTIYAQQWEVICFAEGTRIVTPNGEDAVENLRAGDMVLAMRNGQAGFEALRWVGFLDVAVPRDAAMAVKAAPILIKAGALAPCMPARDLRVSPDHAMEIDGHLIPAKHLVNGESIIQEVWCRRVRYFHLELEAHGLLFSEGTWSESYLDDGNRRAFNNAALTGLFLDFEAGRSQGQYDQQACLPVLRHGLKLNEIHGRLGRRAVELAWGKRMKRG